jgi:hypothetical protein
LRSVSDNWRWPLIIAGTTFGAFAGIVLALSAVGLYALTAYCVNNAVHHFLRRRQSNNSQNRPSTSQLALDEPAG